MDERKWWEAVLMPIVVAALGSGATYFITKTQIESSERLAAAERDSSERKSRVERQVKMLELFNAKIVSENPKDRQMAVRLLSLVDPELSVKLAGAISSNENENPKVREVAREVLKESRGGSAFPVVRSVKDLKGAIEWATKFRKDIPEYPAEVYLAENDYYAVTLGGYLRRDEAERRVRAARNRNLAPDAYVWQSMVWGDNLFKP